MNKEIRTLDINNDLKEKIDLLEPNIAYLANELLADIEKGKRESEIKEFLRDEISEIIKEESR